MPVGVLASAVRGSERPWLGPGKARSLGFPGTGPSLARGAPAQPLVWQPCCGSSHLALDLGLRPVGRGEDVVRAARPGAVAQWLPQSPGSRRPLVSLARWAAPCVLRSTLTMGPFSRAARLPKAAGAS